MLGLGIFVRCNYRTISRISMRGQVSKIKIKFHLVLVRGASGSAPRPSPAAAAMSHSAPRVHPVLANEGRALGHLSPRGPGEAINIFCRADSEPGVFDL